MNEASTLNQTLPALADGGVLTEEVPTAKEPSERQMIWRERAIGAVQSIGWGLASMALALVMWTLFCLTIGKDLPTPLTTFKTLVLLSSTAFRVEDGNMGIGLQIWSSLQRVAVGFGLASVVAIPLGVLMGAVPIFRRLFDPIVQLLRPVSPLVWFPLCLVAFKGMGGTSTATLFTIFITCLWPTMINTAFGVSTLPDDYRTVNSPSPMRKPSQYTSMVWRPSLKRLPPRPYTKSTCWRLLSNVKRCIAV